MKKIVTYLVIICGTLSLALFYGCEDDPDIIDEIDDIVDDGNNENDNKENEVDGNQITAYFTGKDAEIVFPDGGKFTILGDENRDVGDGKIVITTDDDEGYFNTDNSVVFDFSKTTNEYTINFDYDLPKGLISEDIALFFYAADSIAQTLEANRINFDYDNESGELEASFKAPSNNPSRSSGNKYKRLVLRFTSREELAKNPKTHQVRMPFYEQPGNTCWATCAAMMSRAYSASVDRKREIKIIDYVKYMGHPTLDEGIGIYSFQSRLPHAIEINAGVEFEGSSFFSKSNLLDAIIKKLNEDKPLILKLNYPGIGRHAILVVGYEIDLISAANISVKLLYHNPQNMSNDGMYKWADFDWLMKEKWLTEAYQIIYAEESVPSNRSMHTVAMPLKNHDGELSFIVPMKRQSDGRIVEFPINMVYDLDAEYKYHWEFSYGNEEIEAVPDSASVMRLKLPIYNAEQSSKQLAVVYRAYERESGKRLFEESEIKSYNPGSNHYKAEVPVSKFYYIDEDSGEMEERVKVRMEIEIWEGGTYHDGYTIYFEVEQKEKAITLVTAKEIGETINLGFSANPADQAGVWIDLNDNGKRDGGEDVTVFEEMADYTLQSQTISIYGDITVFACEENEITKLELSSCKGLEELWCWFNELTELDVSDCTMLKNLSCAYNKISKLNISGCTMLETVNFNHNQLTSLDLSQLTGLKGLWCGDNSLTSLNISNCTELEDLICHNNQLTSLDVSNNTVLSYLNCENNKIISLDVSGFTNLTDLYCNRNQLTTLNINGCTALIVLDCNENQLKTIKASGCTSLKYLSYNNGQLTLLDVSGCTALESLQCKENKLSTLNITGCTALQSLYCNNNQLTSLNASNLTLLSKLNCNNNQLTSLNINGCSALFSLSCTNNGLLGIVPAIFEDIWLLSYDVRYEYGWDSDNEIYVMTEDTGKGWWYAHEPEGGCHNPNPCN